MAYGTITAPAEGAILPVDTIGGTDFPRTKISFGAEGSVTDVNSGAPLPVSITGSAAVTGTFWQATQPVSIAGTVAVSGPLTDTQLRATAVPVSGTVGISGSVAVTGTFFQATQPVSIANPVAVTGTFWQATQPISAAALPLPTGAGTAANQATMITALGTLGTQTTLAAVLAKMIAAPATEAKQDAQTAAIATIGTRAYGAGQQVAIGATSAASTGLTATEVLLHASSRCFVRVATAATAGAGIPLEAGEKFHLRLTSGQQIHVIRDTADGFLNIVPVA